MNSHTISNCQSCGSSKLKPRFFASYIPSVNVMQESNKPLAGQEFYPAQLLECEECTLVQMGCIVDQHILFPPNYPYTSGTTKALRDNFKELAYECKSLPIPVGSLVVDIGSNDNTLLEQFKWEFSQVWGLRLFGVEPTDTGKNRPVEGIKVNQRFFTEEEGEVIAFNHGKANLITCCNCFAHMPDINDVLKGITYLLADDGIFVSESHYLPSLLKGLQYDVIYHEHLRFYSLTSLSHLLSQHGLNIIDAKEIPTHGGSIRVWAKRDGTMSKRALDLMLAEKESLSDERWKEFENKVGTSKLWLWRRLLDISNNGYQAGLRGAAKIYGIGAPSRSTVLIHYLGMQDILDCVCEVPTSKKIGHFVPGTAIPIVDEECLYRDQPEYAMLLSWHIADELIPKIRERGFKNKFIIPLPYPKVIE